MESRPKSWAELRKRVLDDGYLSGKELAIRKRNAHYLKYTLAFVPLIACRLVLEAIQDGLSLATVMGAVLICGSAISAFRLGVIWEDRWGKLIAEKNTRGNLE